MDGILAIRALGGLEITVADEPVAGFDSRKAPAILVYLASTGRTVPREVLAEMLWEDRTQSQSLANLRVALTSLRQVVGGFVTITRETVEIKEEAQIWLDVAAFEAALSAGELERGVELYRGDFLAGFYVDSNAFEEWALRERERLRLRMQEALDSLISRYLEQGRYAEGIARAMQLLGMDNLREKTHRQLMLLLAQSGEREAALAQYEKLSVLLDEELGVEPTPETQALYDQLRAGMEVGQAVAVAASLPRSVIAQNPYKGLRAFQEHDAADFFGREDLTERLLERLAENGAYARFLAVVGPSGSGKSSVVKAGLLPAIRAGGLPGSERWAVVEVLPGAHPLDELDIALARAAGDPAISLLDELQRDTRGLLRAVRRVLPDACPEMLLVIDQFEEVFTLVQDQAAAKFLLDSLHAAVIDPRSPLRVVITLRADFYDRPLMYPDFSRMVRQRTEAIVPMTTEELEQAVSGPAERVGAGLEPGLVTTIVSEVLEQPGALPMLQYALTELFEQRDNGTLTLAGYHTIGGTLGALARRADAVFADLGTDAQAAAHQIFLRLVAPGEGAEDIRRRVVRSELEMVGGAAAAEALEAFGRSRLLTFDKDLATGEPTVELAHEAIIREWGQLRAWLDESRNDVRLQRLLGRAAGEWQEAGQDVSYLLHGSRLAQFDEWAATTPIALTGVERDFLAESVAADRHRRIMQRRLRNGVLGVAVLIAAVMGVLALLVSDRESQAQQAREHAESAQATSDYNAEVASANAAEARELALVNGARAALVSGDLDTALALAVAANQRDAPSAAAQAILSEAAYQPGTLRRLVGEGLGVIMSIAVSPDGHTALSGGEAGKTTCWDLDTGAVIFDLVGHDPGGLVLDVDISPDGRLGVSIAEDQSIILWDLESGELIRRFGEGEILSPHALTVAFNPDGQTVLSNNGGRSVRLGAPDEEEANLILWDVDTGEPVRVFRGHTAMTGRLAISPDGSTALSGGWGGELILWDIASGEAIRQFGEIVQTTFKVPSDIKYLPDGTQALVLYADSAIIRWDLTTFEALQHYGEPDGYNGYAEFDISPDGRLLLMPSLEDNLAIADVESGAVVMPLPAYNTGAAFTRDGSAVVVGMVSELRLVSIRHGAELGQYVTDLTPGPVTLNPDGQMLYVATDGGFEMDSPRVCEFIAFDVASDQEIHHFGFESALIQELGCPITSIAVSPDGGTVLIGSGASDGTAGRAVLWDAAAGTVLHALQGHDGSFSAAAFSPDGSLALTGGRDDYGLILWDVETGQEIRRLAGHTNSPWRVVFSPDGQTALSGGQDGLILLWDLTTGVAVHQLEGHVGGVNDVEFDPDGSMALSIGDDGRLIMWDVDSGQPMLDVAAEAISGVEFSPDGRYAITSGGRVSIWDLSTGDEVRSYSANWWRQLNLSPDGETLFGIGPDEHIHHWRIDWGEDLLVWVRDNRYVRDLTCDEREQYRIEPLCS